MNSSKLTIRKSTVAKLNFSADNNNGRTTTWSTRIGRTTTWSTRK